MLHIGQSKTGTSAIQAYLTLNRQALAEKGIIYPSVRIWGMAVDLGNHNPVADALVGLLRYPCLKAEEYFDQFFKEARRVGAWMMILSAEHFFGGEPRIWDVKGEQEFYALYRKKVAAVARFLAGHRITLIAYLRPQVDWLASAISQTVRIERLISPRAIYHNDHQFFEMSKPVLQYCRLIDLWVETLRPINVIIVPYERNSLYRKSSIADFFLRVGIGCADFPFASEGLQVNRSLSREYVELKKILNRMRRSKTEERVIIRCLERLSAGSSRFTPYKLNKYVCSQVEEFVASDNARLNRRYIGTPPWLSARSGNLQSDKDSEVKEEEILRAKSEFLKEYNKLNVRVLKYFLATKALMRKHTPAIQALFHQAMRAYRKHMYRNK